MLHSANDIVGYQLQARDGEIAHTKDFLFDDQSWTIRYLVVNTGDWLVGRRILISPTAIQSTNCNSK